MYIAIIIMKYKFAKKYWWKYKMTYFINNRMYRKCKERIFFAEISKKYEPYIFTQLVSQYTLSSLGWREVDGGSIQSLLISWPWHDLKLKLALVMILEKRWWLVITLVIKLLSFLQIRNWYFSIHEKWCYHSNSFVRITVNGSNSFISIALDIHWQLVSSITFIQ